MTEANILNTIVIGSQGTVMKTAATTFSLTDFGTILNFKYSLDNNFIQTKPIVGGVEGHLFKKNIQVGKIVKAEITFQPHNLTFLKYVLGDETGTTIKTCKSKNTIPAYLTVKGKYGYGNEIIKITGLAFDDLKININQDSIIECSATLTGWKSEIATGPLTTLDPPGEPMTYVDGYMTIDGNDVSLESFSTNMNFKIFSKKLFEKVTVVNEKYLTSVIKRTGLEITTEGVFNVDTDTITTLDTLKDFDYVLTLSTGKTLTFKGCEFQKYDKMLSGESDKIETINFSTIGKDVEGTY